MGNPENCTVSLQAEVQALTTERDKLIEDLAAALRDRDMNTLGSYDHRELFDRVETWRVLFRNP